MARRTKARAPESSYRSPSGDVIVLRGTMSPGTRREYASIAPATREDAWQRSVEFLFERLVSSWEIAGAEPITRQKELLGRFRFASQEERLWIRTVVREHLAANFPDLATP